MAVCFDFFWSTVILEDGYFKSSVATQLKRDGIFKYELVANLPLSRQWKHFENRLTFGEVVGKSLVSCFFDSQCSVATLSVVLCTQIEHRPGPWWRKHNMGCHDWLGQGFTSRVVHGLGWVGSTVAKVLKIWTDNVNASIARLAKIWLHQAVKFVSCIGLGPNFSTCSGLG